jgi:hypothetical protein
VCTWLIRISLVYTRRVGSVCSVDDPVGPHGLPHVFAETGVLNDGKRTAEFVAFAA